MGLSLNTIIIFFIYGLAFFCLGLATYLESERSPLLAEAQVLRPLSVFGFLHGIHEWIELILISIVLMSGHYHEWAGYLRIGLLVFSFVSLIFYSVQVFRPTRKFGNQYIFISLGMVSLFLISLLTIDASSWLDQTWANMADVLARYILAVPGALFTALALRQQANQISASQPEGIGKNLKIASWGFGIYGISQLIGPKVDFLFASVLNTGSFSDYFGFPIQLIRAIVAILIAYSLIKATQIVGRERGQELQRAQTERIDALEQVQEEMEIRNAMRKDLLRKIVIVQEEERIRISRELHDETAQYLTAFSVNLAALKDRLPDKFKKEELIVRLHDLSDQMSIKLSRLVHDLRPAQ